MKPLEELTNILCECESVKKDVMELRFGCELYIGEKAFIVTYYNKERPIETMRIVDGDYGREIDYDIIMGDFNIIGKPIQDHQLRMYCREKKIIYNFDNFDQILDLCGMDDIFGLDIEYNGSKPLHQQSDETLTKIINFLKDKLGTHSKVKQ